MTTSTKEQSKGPKDWDVTGAEAYTTPTSGGSGVGFATGTRTYPDGSTQTITAHSEEQMEALAAATDEQTRQSHATRHAELAEEAKQLRDQADALDEQAKVYAWAV